MDHLNDREMELRPSEPPAFRRSRPDDGVTLMEIASTVLRHWRLVISLPLLLVAGVVVWSLSQDRLYAASATFLPQAAEGRGGGGGAAALAMQFGVNLGGDRGGQSPHFYVGLLRSRAVLQEAVETEYRFTAEDGTERSGTLIDYFGYTESASSLPPWRRAAKRLGDNINTAVSRETGVVQVMVVLRDPDLAEQVAARLLEILNAVNNDVRQSPAEEEGRFIAGRLEEARNELAAAESALQSFLRNNRQFRNSPDLIFEHDRLQRRVSIRQEVYTSLLRSQEEARIDAVRDTPQFTVIDHPIGTAEPQGRGTVVRALVALLLGFIIALVVAFLRDAAYRGSVSNDHGYEEFRAVAGQAWRDARNPLRWFRRGARTPAS